MMRIQYILRCRLVASVCALMMLAAAMPMSVVAENYRPRIGVSCSYTGSTSAAGRNYTESIIKAGGVPVILPVTSDSLTLRALISDLDGLVLIGGEDINPKYYKEEIMPECGTIVALRDTCDLLLARMARDFCLPTLGVCRGHQLLNVAYGGSLYQDLPSQLNDTTVNHRQPENTAVGVHKITISPDSELAKILGVEEMMVNTNHHQAVKEVAPGFKVVAVATDGVVEAMEAVCGLPIISVQFHPEALYYRGNNELAGRLFKRLVKNALTYNHARRLHDEAIALDTHTDTSLDMIRGDYICVRSPRMQVNIPRLQEGKVSAQYLGCWVGQKELTDEGRKAAHDRVESLIDVCYSQLSELTDVCGVATTVDDVKRLKSEGKIAFLLGVENGYGIGKDLNVLNHYAERGVTYVTLCHSKNNDICDSSSDKDGALWGGLSDFGKKVVKRMNELGLVVDMSHASETSFWDVIKLTKAPIVCTHSSARALTNHDRNLTDDQLRALAKNGGVIQVCPFRWYVGSDAKTASINDFMDHLRHAIEVAGIDHVGIGTDFDGGGGIPGFNGSNEYLNVTMRLIEAGYSDDDIAKIMGGNYLRVLAKVQSMKKK